jgi:hypothetical protein
MFKELYGSGDNPVSLKPKHHLLVHLPSVTMQSGPLVDMNCMRVEWKNSFLGDVLTLWATSEIFAIHLRIISSSLFCMPTSVIHMYVISLWMVTITLCWCITVYVSFIMAKFNVKEDASITVANRLERA